MILEQYYLTCLAHASYLIVDEETKTAVVVDPQRDVDQYVTDAEAKGAVIRHVLLTHFHADFLAGHLELAARTGATIHMGPAADTEFPSEPLSESRGLTFGQLRIDVLETPGHTPESVSYVVYDLAKSADEPHAVLTGDTLFIGDVGRPDLLAGAGITPQELASKLYDSLHDKILKLPDATLVYPAHGAGSMCGRNLSTETFSTIGEQRRSNYALQPMERAEFIGLVASNQPTQPAYFAYDAQLNRAKRAILDDVLERSLVAMDLEQARKHVEEGAVLLDTRSADAFAARHIPGSVNVGLDGKYATWCGTVIGTDRPIVLITDPGAEKESALRLGRIGYDRVLGYVDGGITAADSASVHEHARLDPDGLRARLSGDAAPLVVDVRTPGEREEAAIEGSLHVPLVELGRRLDELPAGRDLVFVCKTGYRSSAAASLAESEGWKRVNDLAGGMDAWLGLEGSPASCSTA